EMGQLAEAIAAADRSLAGTPPRATRARALAVRGLARGLAGGAREEADSDLAAALALCDDLGLRPSLAEALQFQAELSARRGDAAFAAHLARRARDEYLRCGMRVHAAHAERIADRAR